MELVLVSNVLEHAGFPDFVRAVSKAHPNASILSTGDFLNVFPEPGEDLRASIFYELFGGAIDTEMDRLAPHCCTKCLVQN